MSIEEVDLRTGIRNYAGDPFDGADAKQQGIEGDDERPSARFPGSELERPDEVLSQEEKRTVAMAKDLFRRGVIPQHAALWLKLLLDPASVTDRMLEVVGDPPVPVNRDGLLMFLDALNFVPRDPVVLAALENFRNGVRDVLSADDSR